MKAYPGQIDRDNAPDEQAPTTTTFSPLVTLGLCVMASVHGRASESFLENTKRLMK
jgi:hypothetical protein